VERDLLRLHHLAQRLFDLVLAEFGPLDPVKLHLESCDAVAEDPRCADPIVRTLLTAQTLRAATLDPPRANPRYVVGLGMFADDLIPVLLREHSEIPQRTARDLHDIRGQIDTLCTGLAIAATPGMPDFSS